MGWNDNNSGPWGNKPPKPPAGSDDLDKLVAESRQKIKSFFDQATGGGNDGGSSYSPKFIATLIAVVALLWLATGFYKVNAEEEGVVLRFGKYHRTTTPGLNYHLPFPIETVHKIAVTRINQEEIGSRKPSARSGFSSRRRNVSNYRQNSLLKERLMLTGDINIVDVNFVVQWRIKNARDYLFNVRETLSENTVKNAAESAMREIIGKVPLNAALAKERFAIEQEARDIMQRILDSYNAGILIDRIQMQDSDPPEEVVDAFRSVEAARAEKETLINEAERYRNKLLPEARGEAERILNDAEAYSQQVVSLATGDAQRFTQVYEKYRLAKDVTKKRIYLETMEQVLRDMDKIMIDSEPGSAGVLPFLPLSTLNGKGGS